MTIPFAALLGSAPATLTAAAHSKGGTSLLDPIAKPIAWILAEIYAVVPNYGIAILVLSVLWMLIISPLTLKSTRSMLAMQKLQPQLKRLQEKHRNDRQAFAQAQMDLFREHQVSPFGSCLPMLLPLPIFFALFRVIDGLSHIGSNGVPDPKYLAHTTRMYHDIVAAHGHLDAFGMNLSANAFSHHSSFLAALPFFLLLLIMAGTGYLQSAQMMSRNPSAQQNPQMKLMKYLPVLFVLFVVRFPAGVLLYYSMSNVCRIAQQDAMYRFDPKVKALVAQEVVEVEELTEEIDKEGPGATARPARPAPMPGGTGSKDAPAGRSRFRDLLRQAGEQQQRQAQTKKPPQGAPGRSRDGKAPGARPAPPSSGNGGRPPGTSPGNGAAGKRQGSGRAPGTPGTPGTPDEGPARPTPRGHRTNRKRRGR